MQRLHMHHTELDSWDLESARQCTNSAFPNNLWPLHKMPHTLCTAFNPPMVNPSKHVIGREVQIWFTCCQWQAQLDTISIKSLKLKALKSLTTKCTITD